MTDKPVAPESTPQHCPICGSGDPKVWFCATHRETGIKRHYPSFGDGDTCTNCADDWHNFPESTPTPQADERELAEKFAVMPEHNIGLSQKHECQCGDGIIDPRCELCLITTLLSAYIVARENSDAQPAMPPDFDQLAVDLCRELYDRFMMGGWEPKDAHSYVMEELKRL